MPKQISGKPLDFPNNRSDKAAPRDDIFAAVRPLITDFAFDRKTAAVFDDMVGRSVPYYDEIQRMVCEMAADFATEGSSLYDLGCSTGTTLLALDQVVKPDVRFIGVDNSEAMLGEARRKLLAHEPSRPYDLICTDLHKGPAIENASVVIMILTLPFIRPLYRERLVRRISQGLNDNGCLIVVEKLTTSNTLINRLFIKHYYEMKRRNGYSETEIAQKREALENVMIPYRMEENRELLLESGFRHAEEMFRWYNFAALVAVK